MNAVPASSRWLRHGLALVVALGILAVAIVPRLASRHRLATQTRELAIPTVAVVHPAPLPRQWSIDLPADVQAFQEVPIYARTDGYLRQWTSDIGTKVTAGQLLAVIDAPEVDAQWRQAQANTIDARANFQIARTTADRWQELLKTQSVSRQDAEQNQATMRARQAMLQAAQADAERLGQLRAFEQVRAPFAGIVTARNIDVGALIDAGSTAMPKQALFRLAETDRLRVFAQVPQDDVGDASVGTPVTLTVPQWPGRQFHGSITRTAGAIDPASRTLRVEVDLDNTDGAILPGGYAYLHIQSRLNHPTVTVPDSALVFRPEGVQVATVNEAHRIAMQTVTLGRDFGTKVEILTGLDAHAQVVANPNDAIDSGESVNLAQAADAAHQPG